MRVGTVAGLALCGSVGFAGYRIFQAYQHSQRFPGYWRELAEAPPPPGALRLLALGDSTMQAIGADDPLDGLAGRTADYLEAASGQPVHIANHAVGGATIADILRDQVPHADFARADVVIVSSGNDMERRVAPETYRSNLIKLAEHLPAARTILSDLPVEPGRSRYQPVLAEVADRYGIARADFASAFTSARRPDVFSWLFPHLNSRGYGIWFSAFEPKLDDLLRRATPAN